MPPKRKGYKKYPRKVKALQQRNGKKKKREKRSEIRKIMRYM